MSCPYCNGDVSFNGDPFKYEYDGKYNEIKAYFHGECMDCSRALSGYEVFTTGDDVEYMDLLENGDSTIEVMGYADDHIITVSYGNEHITLPINNWSSFTNDVDNAKEGTGFTDSVQVYRNDGRLYIHVWNGVDNTTVLSYDLWEMIRDTGDKAIECPGKWSGL